MKPDKAKPEGGLADNTQQERPEAGNGKKKKGKARSGSESTAKSIGGTVIDLVFGLIEVISDWN